MNGSPLIAAEGSSFVLKQKNQKFKSDLRLLFALAICAPSPTLCLSAQIRQNLGWVFIAALTRKARALAKIPMPCSRTMPPSFCLISPEAYGLTKRKHKICLSTGFFL